MAGETEAGVLSGAASGAAIGAAIGAPVGGVGALPGAAIGAVIGATAGYFAADSKRKKDRAARKQAEEEAERVRRESIVKQMGAKQQADSLSLTATQGNSKTSSSPANASPGTVGDNMTGSGTF